MIKEDNKMGHRALIGKTQKDGSIKVYYSHWGALNAYNAGDKQINEPWGSDRYSYATT